MWTKYPEITKGEWKDCEQSFKRKARFLVDENMGNDVAIVLKEFGYNSIFVGDVGLVGHDDKTVFAYAWKTKRLILTHDMDYLDDKRFPFHRNPWVIVLPVAEGDGDLEPAISD